jgi:hypothetical protein
VKTPVGKSSFLLVDFQYVQQLASIILKKDKSFAYWSGTSTSLLYIIEELIIKERAVNNV